MAQIKFKTYIFLVLAYCLRLNSLMLMERDFSGFELHDYIFNDNIFQALYKISITKNLDELYEGMAPLHLAVEKGRPELVLTLIKAGANVNLVAQSGESPADIALYCYHDVKSDFKGQAAFRKILNILAGYNAKLFLQAKSELYIYMQIENILFSDFGRQHAPLMYPFVVDNKDFFIILQAFYAEKKCEAWLIQEVLESIVEKGFPFSEPCVEATFILFSLLKDIKASKSLEKKLKKVILPRSLDRPLESTPQTLTTFGVEKRVFQVNILDPVQLALTYTTEEHRLFKNIQIQDLLSTLFFAQSNNSFGEYQKFKEDSLALFSFILLNEKSTKKRNLYAHKFVNIADEFLKLKNISGVDMMIKALSNENLKKKLVFSINAKSRIKKLKKIVSSSDNYKIYRKYVSDSLKGLSYMPIFAVIEMDILRLVGGENNMINDDKLFARAVILQHLLDLKNML